MPQIPKLPPLKFNALTVEACVYRKFVKHVTSQHLQQFELDARSLTPSRQEQLRMTGMPTKQHDTAYALGWLQPLASSILVPSWQTPLQQS